MIAATKTLVSYTYYNHVMWRTQTLQPISPKLPLSQLVLTAATKTLISYTHYNHVMWRTQRLEPIRPKIAPVTQLEGSNVEFKLDLSFGFVFFFVQGTRCLKNPYLPNCA